MTNNSVLRRGPLECLLRGHKFGEWGDPESYAVGVMLPVRRRRLFAPKGVRRVVLWGWLERDGRSRVCSGIVPGADYDLPPREDCCGFAPVSGVHLEERFRVQGSCRRGLAFEGNL